MNDKTTFDKSTQIIHAAITLFAKEGIGIATSKIAKEANISNGTLFNYFETKQELIDAVYLFIKEKISHDMLDKIQPDLDTKTFFHDLWTIYIHWTLQHIQERNVLELLKSSQILSPETIKAGENLFAFSFEAIQQAIDNKEILNLPIALVGEITHSHLNATINYIHNNNIRKKEIEKTIDLSFQAYWEGFQI